MRKEAKTVSLYWPLWPLSEMFCHAPLALESIGIFHNVFFYPLSLADVSIFCSLERSLAPPVFNHLFVSIWELETLLENILSGEILVAL